MPWDHRRGGRRYYYRSVRRHGKPVREYVGTGERGEKAAKDDAEKRAARAEVRAREREERQSAQEIAEVLDRLAGEVRSLMLAELATWGYHLRRGEFRRRRTHARGDRD